MPGRIYTAGTNYRYGFNGQEKSDEIDANGNHNTALFWEYDTRLGRRWNIDPVGKSSISPYIVLGNSPIQYVDPLGADWYRKKTGTGENKSEEAKWFDGSGPQKGYLRTGNDNQVTFQGSSGGVVVTGVNKKARREFKDYMSAKWTFEQRSLDDMPTIQPGDNQKYKDLVTVNLGAFERGAKAEKEYRQMSYAVAAALVSPFVVAAIEGGALYYLVPRVGFNASGAAGDFVNQTLIQNKTWKEYNIASTASAAFLGGNNIIATTLYGASGNIFDVSFQNTLIEQKVMNKTAGASFTAGFAGNLLGNAGGTFITKMGQHSIRTGLYSASLARGIAITSNTLIGIGLSPAANELENKLK